VKVSELGEFGLIDLIDEMVGRKVADRAGYGKELLLGIGDDTAAWKCKGKTQLATTDTLVQDVHFKLERISWEELGYKSIAVNLSDIAAMGGIPQYALVSICLPGDTDVENIRELYRGMLDVSDKYKTIIAGGNITSSDRLIINVTIYGYTDNGILTRSSAKPGDKIAVTGFTGLSRAGLRIMKQPMEMDHETLILLRKAQNQPEPRLEFGQILAKAGVKTAIDISDGLVADLQHICSSSKVSARIDLASVPVHPLLKQYFKDDCVSMILAGGEDYELLFTASDHIMNKVKNRMPDNVFIIGTIQTGDAGTVDVLDNKGNKVSLKESGWDHFK
jgi:thiamine-monophosphate kinase